MKKTDSNRASGMRRWVPTIAALAVIMLTVSLGNWQLRELMRSGICRPARKPPRGRRLPRFRRPR